MVWKQDLAKLKQQLDPDTPPAAPKPPPKPNPKPAGPVALDDEDAVFLSAMGLKPAASRPPRPAAGEPASEPSRAADPHVPETFQEAIKDLKGFKPLMRGIPDRPAAVPSALPVADRLPVPTPDPVPPPVPKVAPHEPSAPEPETLVQSFMPLRFQLAAGMAIEVDGSLDLRGHSLSDAIERLRDRLGDGQILGWRSLQVILGPDPILHEGLLGLLASGQVPMVARFAQAPVPMGGTQAWLLYFGHPPVQPGPSPMEPRS
jgi:hypothetical protein